MYKNNHKIDGIYLIKKGEFEVSKEINVKKQIELYLEKTK
jgi:hypothetical protein